MKIITQQLAEKLPPLHKLLSNQAVDPQNHSTLYSILKEAQQITIYDLTTTNKHDYGTIISVNDHINRTGENPLINNKLLFNIDFINLCIMYKKEQKSVITDCCGKNLNRRYPYPSHYLCNISIIAKVLDIKKIAAYLVNIV